jgi:hypothetical protein
MAPLLRRAAITVIVIALLSTGVALPSTVGRADSSCPVPGSPTPKPFGCVLVKGQDWAPAYTSNSIGLDVMSNGDGTVSQGHLIGKQYIGEEWQCVELAQRWALVFSKESPAKWPVRAAFEMWGAGPSLPIKWLQHPNGGADSPEPGDLLVFKQSVHSTQ